MERFAGSFDHAYDAASKRKKPATDCDKFSMETNGRGWYRDFCIPRNAPISGQSPVDADAERGRARRLP
jgi:hypothetical protein